MTERPEHEHAVRNDVLSDVLRAVRVKGAAYFAVTASTPWVAESPHARELARYVMPGAEHVIHYHLVTSGRCFGGLIGEDALLLEPGDIIVFPHGDAHAMSSASGMRGPIDLSPHETAAAQGMPVRLDFGGTGRDPVEVICGFFAWDARPFNPLLAALPRVVQVNKRKLHGAVIDQFIACAMAEARARRPGGQLVLARLSELMFVEVVCAFVSGLDAPPTGWLSGLRDDVVGRALSLLHAHPREPWTLESLARAVGASRSALADRFMKHVKVPPMQYLALWRMQLASTMLEGQSSLAEIADAVGYGSEAAFSRAFKKTVGVAPAAWRATRR
jgi:AraC-like DNA-binding protein